MEQVQTESPANKALWDYIERFVGQQAPRREPGLVDLMDTARNRERRAYEHNRNR
jgi:hypothetical protein